MNSNEHFWNITGGVDEVLELIRQGTSYTEAWEPLM